MSYLTSHNLAALLCLGFALALAGCASAPQPIKTPETYLKEGDAFYANRNYEDAIAEWKRVKESYASPELTIMAELKIADAQYDNGNYIEAAASYEEFRKLHPANEKADYALYRLGLCNYNQITGIDTDQTPVKNAVTLFESFLRLYPKSSYASEVQDKLDVCRMKQVQYEIYVGRFYLRNGNYQSAIKRLEEALATFPKSPFHDETLFYLGEAYLRAGNREKGRGAFTRLFSEFRTSKYVEKARSVMDSYY
ncbi:outer membrane protein assembly factor BamD [Geomobilimonas luticola]|uniref:Outer membrane protein assembly factor BamD n=1 Tax=Geomobilimonas luticola TaxID=1114878 RepID=A0ABS5SBH3_9BACT|nr:outer membrane protein assembly factor BamD [Geomobilimonas luticola]MBT0652710.1 outer membrane protein assembly factor BamD [Geomobilimonas luticola]